MKIARIKNRRGLEETIGVEWKPIDYDDYPRFFMLDDEDIENWPIEYYNLLIEEGQIVKIKTEDNSKETYLRATRSQFDDRKGRVRTDEFEYYPCFEKELVDEGVIEQLKKETDCQLWGCGFKFNYKDIFVPWHNK